MKKLFTLLVLLTFCYGKSSAQWIPQPSDLTPGLFVQFLDAVDTNVVWGLASDPASQLTPVQEFTKTIDGGNLWIANPINNAAGLSPSGIFALNADTAWVAMFNGAAGGGKILKTIDGGINWTWQPTAVFAAPSGFPNMVYFYDADNGICMGDPTGGYFEIYTTSDGGTNWIRTPQANIATQLAGEFGITSVYTTSGDSSMWFGTNLGRIYKTIDRGLNWTVASTPYNGFYIGDIAFRDANNGIATNGSAGALADAIRTTDGGATWTLIPANTAGILNKVLSYVPGTDSTYFLSSPQLGGGTAFTVDDANTWVLVDNLIHSDIEFVSPTTGWTGSNELGAPMFKWVGPIAVSCAQLLGPLEFVTADSICAGDSIVYSIHVDFTNDPQNRLGFNVIFYDEIYNQIGAQSLPDLVAAGFPNSFVPDVGQTTIGTFTFTVFFNVAPTNEIVHFALQVFPTQCADDTSNTLINSVFQNVINCAQVAVTGYIAQVDMSSCPLTGLVNYTYSYSVNSGPPIPGQVFDCIGYTGINNVIFFIDNGVCIREFSTTINCTGVGIEELDANAVSLHPNPAVDMLTIQTKQPQYFTDIRISDITGRTFIELTGEALEKTTISIPVHQLNAGTYLVRFTDTGGQILIKKFVKM